MNLETLLFPLFFKVKVIREYLYKRTAVCQKKLATQGEMDKSLQMHNLTQERTEILSIPRNSEDIKSIIKKKPSQPDGFTH